MIVRDKRINVNANEIKLSISFSKVDVLKWLRYYAHLSCNTNADGGIWWLSEPQCESDVRYWLEHDSMALASFEAKWRVHLSAWAWNVAVREKYFVHSSTPGSNQYYPSEILLKRVGRPKKEY